MEMSNMVVIC